MATEAPNRIRELRANAMVSQQAIATAIGVSKVTISELERGLLPLTLKYMRGIAQTLAVNPGDLLNLEDNPTSLTREEHELLDGLRRARPECRHAFLQLAKVMLPINHES